MRYERSNSTFTALMQSIVPTSIWDRDRLTNRVKRFWPVILATGVLSMFTGVNSMLNGQVNINNGLITWFHCFSFSPILLKKISQFQPVLLSTFILEKLEIHCMNLTDLGTQDLAKL